jgi:hypothetical protein
MFSDLSIIPLPPFPPCNFRWWGVLLGSERCACGATGSTLLMPKCLGWDPGSRPGKHSTPSIHLAKSWESNRQHVTWTPQVNLPETETEYLGTGLSNGYLWTPQVNLPETETKYLGTGLSNGYLWTPQVNLPETETEYLGTGLSNGYLWTPQVNLPETETKYLWAPQVMFP